MPTTSHTREELLAARKGPSLARLEDTDQVRIVTADDRRVPVAYEPRSTGDVQPWTEYNPADGHLLARHSSADCVPAVVTEQTKHIDGDSVAISVINRLKAAGITCELEGDGGASYVHVRFADDSLLSWGAVTWDGADAFCNHPIGEHGQLNADWADWPGGCLDEDDEKSLRFTTGIYAVDSEALVQRITALADKHGRIPTSI